MSTEAELYNRYCSLADSFRDRFSAAANDADRERWMAHMKSLSKLEDKFFQLRIAEELKDEKKIKRLMAVIKVSLDDFALVNQNKL